MSMGNFPEVLSQQILAGRILVGRLGVQLPPRPCPEQVGAVAAWWFDNPNQKVAPRSRIPGSTSHFSYVLGPLPASVSQQTCQRVK